MLINISYIIIVFEFFYLTSPDLFISLFRTMGARHLVVVDGELAAVGVITRADMNEHRLAHFWHEEVQIVIVALLNL